MFKHKQILTSLTDSTALTYCAAPVRRQRRALLGAVRSRDARLESYSRITRDTKLEADAHEVRRRAAVMKPSQGASPCGDMAAVGHIAIIAGGKAFDRGQGIPSQAWRRLQRMRPVPRGGGQPGDHSTWIMKM
jgi:hypothetical protein